PEKKAVHILQDPTHPLVQVSVRKLIVEEGDRVLGIAGLNVRNGFLLVNDIDLVIGDGDLLTADYDILLGEHLRELPLFLPPLIAGQRRKYGRSSRIFTCD